MKSRVLKLILSLLFCSASFGEAYICNLDYHEDISKDPENPQNINKTAVFFLDDYDSGHIVSYTEELGDFAIQITYKQEIEIKIKHGQQIKNDFIKHQDIKKRFNKSYVNGRSGLKINCQLRSIGFTKSSGLQDHVLLSFSRRQAPILSSPPTPEH
jgi:hypothetical protein